MKLVERGSIWLEPCGDSSSFALALWDKDLWLVFEYSMGSGNIGHVDDSFVL